MSANNGIRLYPAWDPWHEPDLPTAQDIRNDAWLAFRAERSPIVPLSEGPCGAYNYLSAGESLEAWRERRRREAQRA